MRLVWCALSITVACDRAPSKSAPAAELATPETLVGISPSDFHCETLVTAEALAELLGGPARQLDTAVSTPPGVPAPCSYLVSGVEPQAWTFDIDCRDGMKLRADALFEQYERTSAELVELAAAEPKRPLPDGGRPRRAPEPAREVAVGSRALDHHGQGLLFIDDDAPCYVRIVGPNAERRLALARHLATVLTPRTAPMSPRRAPR